MAVGLHNFIDRTNVLNEPTMKISEYLSEHPNLYKAALIANHIFRMVAMVAFITYLPLTLSASACICFASSLFYRLTVENNCAYKFALPAFAGSLAFLAGQTQLTNLISGVAFSSLSAFSAAFVSILPLTAYGVYVSLTVSYDVEEKLGLHF